MLLNRKNIQILEPFIFNYNKKITASEIARIYNLNQKSVYLFLESLEKDSILLSEFQGKNKLYFFNKDNKELVKHFICVVEHSRTINFFKKNPELKFIFHKILPHINGTLVVFGSYAKNIQKEDSDLDLFVLGHFNEKEIDIISKTFNMDVNIKFQKRYKDDTLTKEIKKNHIIVKGIEKFIESVWDG